MTRILFIFFAAVVICGCSREEPMPPTLSSMEYDMAGKHFVPALGKITNSKKISGNDIILRQTQFSTHPVTFAGDLSFAVGTQTGELLIFSAEDSLSHRISLSVGSPVREIVSDNSTAYVLQIDGTVSAIAKDGKLRWHLSIGKMPFSNSLLIQEKLYITRDSQFLIVNAKTGAIEKTVGLTTTPFNLTYDNDAGTIALILSPSY